MMAPISKACYKGWTIWKSMRWCRFDGRESEKLAIAALLDPPGQFSRVNCQSPRGNAGYGAGLTRHSACRVHMNHDGSMTTD